MRYGILRITVGGHVPDPILARDLQSVPLTPFGRSVLGGQTPAPAADSGIVGRVLVSVWYGDGHETGRTGPPDPRTTPRDSRERESV